MVAIVTKRSVFGNAPMVAGPPTFLHERELLAAGYTAIVGVDEAGTGAFAGPIVAGAIVLPFTSRLGELDDSKKKTSTARERLYTKLVACTDAWGVGMASVGEIHELGLRAANYLAMRRAIEKIAAADFALVDAWTIPELKIQQRGIIHGDAFVKSIAAASIIAKVTRDRLMRALHEQFPVYGFDRHKGYGTAAHLEALEKFGLCEAHRAGWGKRSVQQKTSYLD